MSFVSFANLSSATKLNSTSAPTSWVSRHYCFWKTDKQPCPFPSAYVDQSAGCPRRLRTLCKVLESALSREGYAAGKSGSCKPSSAGLSLSKARSVWQTRSGHVQKTVNSEQRLHGSDKISNRDSRVLYFSNSSHLRVHGFKERFKFGSRCGFHTTGRQEGQYICGSSHSAEGEDEVAIECRFENLEENGVAIHQGSEIAIGTELGNNAIELEDSTREIWVVNFYHFVSIEDPHLEVARHTSFLEGRDVRGRIYISHQGINAQLSGQWKEAIEYSEWVKEDPRFSNLLVQVSPSRNGHAFPRLRLRYKPSLVQVEGGTLHLPITDPSARAVHLTPHEWTKRLDSARILNNNDAAVSQELESLKNGLRDETIIVTSNARPVVLLDVRNGYEWDIGHFKGAQRPNVDCFKSTEFGLTESETVSGDPLANVDKEAVDVMMYCTGGIRCDVFSTMLRQKGFKNLYSLKGGVSNYLKEEGPRKWAGNLFVFDSRLAVSPQGYQTNMSTEEVATLDFDKSEGVDFSSTSASQTFARCRLCGDLISEPRHRNCANLDCNLLYLSCESCVSQHKGCCSHGCSSAPNLRPLLVGQQYARWHNYRPIKPTPPVPDGYVSKQAMKRRRRKEQKRQLNRDRAARELSEQILEKTSSFIGSV